MSFRVQSLAGFTGDQGFGLDNYEVAVTDPSVHRLLLNSFVICTASMAVMLAIALPLAYLLAFRVNPRRELLMLLLLVLAGELNPLIRFYAWRTILGRQGVVNYTLQLLGIVDQPIDELLFSRLAVVIVLSATYISYTTIPVYAAMKAIEPGLIEAASDLGSRFLTTFRRVLLPLAAPGIFVAIIVVYIPLYSEFAAPELVGGTHAFLIGNLIQEQVLTAGNIGMGSALSFMLLIISGLVSLVAYRAARLRRLGG
jgi:spermidine/putrescine transport system permease protein